MLGIAVTNLRNSCLQLVPVLTETSQNGRRGFDVCVPSNLFIANLFACFLSYFLVAQDHLKIKIGLGCRTQETERNSMSCLMIPQCLDSVFFFSRYLKAISRCVKVILPNQFLVQREKVRGVEGVCMCRHT